MKGLIFIALLCGVFQLKAQNQQQLDSLTIVNFFGTNFAVKNGMALTLTDLKPLVKDNPEIFKEFKRARNFKRVIFLAEVTGAVAVTLGVFSQNNQAFWAGLIGGAGIIATGVIIADGPYSRSISKMVYMYNQSLREVK